MKSGTLYGIGVGPGDPEMITLKAVNILGRVDVVFAAASTKNDYSLAVEIAKPHIPEATPIRNLSFPMTRDKSCTRKAWNENATAIIRELEAGKDVAFLTLGDSMTYSTYGYILRSILELVPDTNIVTVPGITSYQAAAACINTPLVEGEESLLVVSGAEGGDRLRELSGRPENVVFLKAYRNIGDIDAALVEAGGFESRTCVSNCGLPEQTITRDIGELSKKKPQYWTLIIAKQNKQDNA